MNGGWSLDWTITDPITGKVWDLSSRQNQEEVLRMVWRDKPRLLVACPPCTLFSKLQMIEGDPEIRCLEKWKEAVKLVEFAVQVCRLQHELGVVLFSNTHSQHPLGGKYQNFGSCGAWKEWSKPSHICVSSE